MRIPFNVPFVHGREVEYIREAIANRHFAGNGPFTGEVSLVAAEPDAGRQGAADTLLHRGLGDGGDPFGVGPGDEVIMPSFTFVSTANAFVLRGATPVFVDIRDDTCNLDEALVENAITPRTKAIVVVHYAGVACSMDRDSRNRATPRSARDRGRGAGHPRQLSRASAREPGRICAAVSFHETKNVIAGEGGALIVNDAAMGRCGRRSSGKRDQPYASSFKGPSTKYLGGHRVVVHAERNQCGVSVRAARSRQHDYRTAARRCGRCTHDAFAPWECKGGRAPADRARSDCSHNAASVYLLFADLAHRTAVQSFLRRAGIDAVFHYDAASFVAGGPEVRTGRRIAACDRAHRRRGCSRLPGVGRDDRAVTSTS